MSIFSPVTTAPGGTGNTSITELFSAYLSTNDTTVSLNPTMKNMVDAHDLVMITWLMRYDSNSNGYLTDTAILQSFAFPNTSYLYRMYAMNCVGVSSAIAIRNATLTLEDGASGCGNYIRIYGIDFSAN